MILRWIFWFVVRSVWCSSFQNGVHWHMDDSLFSLKTNVWPKRDDDELSCFYVVIDKIQSAQCLPKEGSL